MIMQNGGDKNDGKDNGLKPLLDLAVMKAFVAGILVGNLNRGLMVGFILGAIGGIYIQQNNKAVPNVSKLWSEIKEKWSQSR